MSYIKTQWVTGDTVTDEKLNKIENGIKSIENEKLDADAIRNYRTSLQQDSIDATKQDVINDIEDIRSGAKLGATAVQPEAGKGLFSGAYDDLTGKPTIPTNLSQLTADSTHRIVTDAEKVIWNNKSTVSVSSTGTSDIEVNYITINGVEQKLPTGSIEQAVRWDTVQNALTDANRKQARQNIDLDYEIIMEDA